MKITVPGPREELVDLIAAACKQPGVRELMQVYRQCEALEAAMRAYRGYLGVRRVSVISNSSDENILQGKMEDVRSGLRREADL